MCMYGRRTAQDLLLPWSQYRRLPLWHKDAKPAPPCPAAYHDCFRMFNPLTREALESTVDTWAAGILALLTLLPAHPDVPAASELRGDSGNASRQVQEAAQRAAAGAAGAPGSGTWAGAEA